MSERMKPSGGGGWSSSDGEFSDYGKRPFRPRGGEYGDPDLNKLKTGQKPAKPWAGKSPPYKYPKDKFKPKKPKPGEKGYKPGKKQFPNMPKGRWPGRLPAPGNMGLPRGFNFSPFGPLDPREWPGNLIWGPPSLQGPSGYEFPGMGPVEYHWGPYSCGSTPRIAWRRDNGWLSPEGTFACVGGQVFNQDLSPDEYGADFTFDVNPTDSLPSMTLGRRNLSVLAPRMTLIEHWGWTGPQPAGPQPANFRGPKIKPTPGWDPPEPQPEPPPRDQPRYKGDPPQDDPPPGPGDSGPPYQPDPKKPPHLPPSGPGKKGPKWKIPHNPWGDLYGWLTELGDLLDCLEKATGAPRSWKNKPLHERAVLNAMRLWENPGLLTDKNYLGLAKFGACMAIENTKDFAIGKMGELANEITKSPYWVRPVGFEAGGWAQRF